MTLIENCHKLLQAYKEWKLWRMDMPEDAYPGFLNDEERLTYFTLPMALNYQRDSYALWQWATKTYEDASSRRVFDIAASAQASTTDLQQALGKYKIALQPNKHIATWSTIAQTIVSHRWTISELLIAVDCDFLELQKVVQGTHKKWFPYLSWPKIFHYRSHILEQYCDVIFTNREHIDIAPDTHVLQCSVKLWVLTQQEADTLSKEQVSQKWREHLHWSGIAPIDMHSPLWFWSRNGFQYEL
jgi:hypothetical protein